MEAQVLSSLIQTGGGFLTGALAVFGGNKALRGRKPSAQDQRCERICASMVGISETLLAVMEAIGANDPRIAPHVAQLEVRVADARTFLDQQGTSV